MPPLDPPVPDKHSDSTALKPTPSTQSQTDWVSSTASDCWNATANFVSEHKALTATLAVAGGLTAAALLRSGGAAKATEALVEGSSGEAAAAKGLHTNLQVQSYGAKSLLTEAPAFDGKLLQITAVEQPVLRIPEYGVHYEIQDSAYAVNRLTGYRTMAGDQQITPSGIHLITTDLSNLGLNADAYPHIPKLLVSDNLMRIGGLVTDFKGDLPKLYETAEHSVVHLQATRMIDGVNFVRNGSGFFLHREGQLQLGTAYHVVKDAEEIQLLSSTGEMLPVKASLERADPRHDIALLSLVRPPREIIAGVEPFAVRPYSELLAEREQVVGFGYPNGEMRLKAMPGNFANWKEIQLGPTEDQTGRAMLSYMQAAPGASGGALVDEKGRLFGALVQMHRVSPSTWSVPISYFF